MKTLPRVVLAMFTLVGPMSMADTRSNDARPADAVESTDMHKPAAGSDRMRVGPTQSDLEQRVNALETELERVREQQLDRWALPANAWNVDTDGP